MTTVPWRASGRVPGKDAPHALVYRVRSMPGSFVRDEAAVSVPARRADLSLMYFPNDSDHPAWFDDVTARGVGSVGMQRPA